MGLCPPLSVSVCHKWVFYRNCRTNRASFWHLSSIPSAVLHCVKTKFGYLQNKAISIWNFVLNSGLRKFRHGISIVETCYQLSSRKVDAQSVINWAVVDQLSRYYPPAPTLDHCSLSHRSSSAVYSTILSHGSISDS